MILFLHCRYVLLLLLSRAFINFRRTLFPLFLLGFWLFWFLRVIIWHDMLLFYEFAFLWMLLLLLLWFFNSSYIIFICFIFLFRSSALGLFIRFHELNFNFFLFLLFSLSLCSFSLRYPPELVWSLRSYRD